MPEPAPARRFQQLAWFSLAGAAALFLFQLARIAVRLNVDYWDTYDYLNNALILTGQSVGIPYNISRPPFVSFANVVPLFFYDAGSSLTNTAPHLIALLLSIAQLAALYWLLRQQFRQSVAAYGVALLLLNPLFVHYSVFALADIPGVLFLTCGFGSYYKRNYRWAAVGFFFAVLSRYTNLLALGSLVVFEIASGTWRDLLTYRRLKPFIVGGIALYAVHLPIFLLTIKPLWKSLLYLGAVLRGQFLASQQSGFVDPPSEYPIDIAICFTLPVCALAVGGLIRLLVRRNRLDLLMFSWLFLMLLSFTLATHKEARYLMSLFPPFIYAVVSCVEWLWERWSNSLIKVAVCVPLIFVGSRGLDELKRFDDPTYTQPFLKQVRTLITSKADPKLPIYWAGIGLYNVYPRNHYLFPSDEFIYFHHLNPTGLAFVTGRPVERLSDPKLFSNGTLITTNNRMYANMQGFEAPEPPEPLTVTISQDGVNREVYQLRFR